MNFERWRTPVAGGLCTAALAAGALTSLVAQPPQGGRGGGRGGAAASVFALGDTDKDYYLGALTNPGTSAGAETRSS